MNNDNLQKKIEQKVLERLRGGKIAMRSRAYFATRVTLTIAVSLLILMCSAYILSFIAFSIHESGEQFLLGFGGRGIRTFFALFPWLALLADIALILFLEWLLQKFKFGYRISLLALFGAAAAASALIAFAIGLTPLHGNLLDLADRGNLPVLREMYEGIRDSHRDQGVLRGTIISIQGNRIVITHDDRDHDADDGTRTVILPVGYSTTMFSIGERVYVFGAAASTTIQAYGVNQLSPDQ